MGWFSSACSYVGGAVSSAASSVGRAVSSTANAIGRGVSAAYNGAKEVAGKAVGWMADKAEGFVDGVKNVWRVVKPFVGQIRAALKSAAAAAANSPYPWLAGVFLALDKGLGALTAFENSPIAKKVDLAIKWSIKLAQRWQNRQQAQERPPLTDEELEEARRHQENLRFAEREVVSEDQRHSMELASVFNDYEIASADLSKAIEAAPADFEHYLRLRASQKLLGMSEKKFHTAKTVDDLSADDIFLVSIASDLMKPNPELSKEAALRLDRVLTEKYGKKLLPFVFEELIASWAKRSEVMGNQWTQDNKAYAKDSSSLKFLRGAKDIQSELSAQEEAQFTALERTLPEQKIALDALATKQRDLERYTNAAEGLLQVLEKTEEQIIAEDRQYLLDDSTHVGQLLIDNAQNDKPFSALNAEDQSLMTDYANIFKNESKTRMKGLLEVTA